MDTINLDRTWYLGPELAKGGFGKIHLAKSAEDEEVVIKLVPKLPGTHRELLFEGLAGKPNILPILETGEWGDFWVLVMPRAEKSLRENLAEHGGSLPIHGGLDVPSDIVTALASLEDDVVHRDLKPENILLFEGIERLSIKYGWG